MQIGRVYDAACVIALDQDNGVADDVVIPVVAECDDSFLNDCRRMQVEYDDVATAHTRALGSRGTTSPPDEGSVGAGTGMSCLGFKGGIGTASRVTPDGRTVAVLLLTNFGERRRLTVAGVPVGRRLPPVPEPKRPAGSCFGAVVTDAPVAAADCARIARRVGLGLAKTGSTGHHGSGEIFLGASTSCRTDRNGKPEPHELVAGRDLDNLFEAVVDATEESVLNSMLQSHTVVGRDGNTEEGLDPAVIAGLLGL
jgi:D-aminopeptidase